MNRENERLEKLETEIIGVKFELNNNSETLKEIKDVLVKQSDILSKTLIIKENVAQLKETVRELEQTFEQRKTVTDNNNKEVSSYINRAKGALAICMIVFGIVQTAIYDSFSENQVAHKEFQQEIKVLQKQVTVLETKVDKSTSKTQQNASE